MIYAHIETGVALEPQPALSVEDYIRLVAGNHDTSGWTIEKVPDGTAHGASPDGQGGWINPVLAPAPPQYKPQSQIEFITLCQDIGGMTDDMLVACQSDALFAAMWIKFRASSVVERSDARIQRCLAGLVQAGYLPNGADAVNAAWPEM